MVIKNCQGTLLIILRKQNVSRLTIYQIHLSIKEYCIWQKVANAEV